MGAEMREGGGVGCLAVPSGFERVAAGLVEETAFERLWRCHEPSITAQARRLAARYRLADEDIHELVQETRIALFQAAPRLGLFRVKSYLRGSLLAYLRGILARSAADAARARVRRPLVLASELSDRHDAWETLVEAEPSLDGNLPDQFHERAIVALLRAAIEQLPRGQRDAIDLVRLRGASYLDAAVALGVTVGTVKSQVHDGLASLRRRAEAERWVT